MSRKHVLLLGTSRTTRGAPNPETRTMLSPGWADLNAVMGCLLVASYWSSIVGVAPSIGQSLVQRLVVQASLCKRDLEGIILKNAGKEMEESDWTAVSRERRVRI